MDKIIQVPINDIKPYENNPRIITSAVEAVKKSIKTYGFVDPVYVDVNYVIIVGHARYQAAKELGMTEIDVVVWDITEDKAKPYRLVDNKIHEYSTWDSDLWQELKEFKDFDIIKKMFPEFNKEAGTDQMNFTPITNDQVNKNEEKSKVKFTEFTTHNQKSLFTITCPDCGRKFNLKKQDVINDIKYKGGA